MQSSHLPRRSPARRLLPSLAFRRPSFPGVDAHELARRLLHFWIVWSALLLVHEAGHAVVGLREGLEVRRVTVGVGPVLWRGHTGDTEVVMRLVPVAGLTTLRRPERAPADSRAASGTPPSASHTHAPATQDEFAPLVATLAGGVLATLLLAALVAGIVAAVERGTGSRWRWGRIVVADAIVLTIFNLLPVPPLDGGRAVVGAISAWRGMPLSGDTLFWVHLGGLALAIVPMTLWTRWTAHIDAIALRWRAPSTTSQSCRPGSDGTPSASDPLRQRVVARVPSE